MGRGPTKAEVGKATRAGARALRDELQKLGYRVWWDGDSSHPTGAFAFSKNTGTFTLTPALQQASNGEAFIFWRMRLALPGGSYVGDTLPLGRYVDTVPALIKQLEQA